MVWTPNLLVPGVAKCGTTTLHDMLVAHPRITGGNEKEVRFLMDADDVLCPPINIRDSGLEAWKTQYADKGSGDFDYWLDASPQYQFQTIALETVAALESKPKVIFITRRPSRRLFSLYQYARYHQRSIPHITSFAQFIGEVKAPAGTPIERQKMMRSAWSDSQYDRMLEQWSAVVPKENLFLTSVEELNSQRETVLRALARWLGVDADGFLNAESALSNPTVRTRSRFIMKKGAKLAKVLPETRSIRALKSFVRDLNTGRVDRSELIENEALLAEIDDEFAPSMERYEAMRSGLSTSYLEPAST